MGTGTETLGEGTRIGDLLLLRPLGKGAQGVVWEARQESLDRVVAVKILPRDVLGDSDHLERFVREAEAAGRLSHPNIVAVYGRQEWQGHHLIVQELVAGGSLEASLDGRPQGRAHHRWCADIARQLGLALQHAHEKGVVHRDLKPGNVLLAADGTPKIADFGLAKVADKMALSTTGMVIGTPNFMSPEQVDGRTVDARSDVYGLGAVLYRMLCGRLPFVSGNLQALFLDVLSRAPAPPRKFAADLDRDLEAVCLKAMEKAPHQRYASARELAEDLGRFLAGESTLARPIGLFGRGARQVRRLATSTLAVVALLVPALWLLVDLLALQPLAREDVGVHAWRFGWVALATLLLAWPLAQLAVRLAGGKPRAAIAGWLAALLLGGGVAFVVNEQRLDRIHAEARADLLLQVDFVEREDVQDIQQFVARHGDRFTAEDLFLVARAYLRRDRPAQAEEWLGRLASEELAGPALAALQAVVWEATGLDEPAARAASELWASPSPDWRAWIFAGEVLRQTRRFAEARTAFERAAGLPGVNRDLLNRSLALVDADLCQWGRASEELDDFLKWRPADTTANELAFRIACATQDWASAERHLAVLAARPDLPARTQLEHRHALILARDGEAAGLALVDEVGAGDAVATEWSAKTLLDAGTRVENARTSCMRSRALYEELQSVAGYEFASHVGQAAALIKLGGYEEGAVRRGHYEQAAAHLQRALELDESFWQAHYNLGLATKRLVEGKATKDMSAEELRSFLPHYVTAVGCNGLEWHALNDAAFALGHLGTKEHDAALLAEALGYARRAARLCDPARAGGVCELRVDDRSDLSACHDTVRELLLLQGDHDGALASAQAALVALEEGDPKYELRQQAVLELLQP